MHLWTECCCKILIFKIEEDENILKQNSAVSPNRRKSLAEKLKLIKYAEEALMKHLITMVFFKAYNKILN